MPTGRRTVHAQHHRPYEYAPAMALQDEKQSLKYTALKGTTARLAVTAFTWTEMSKFGKSNTEMAMSVVVVTKNCVRFGLHNLTDFAELLMGIEMVSSCLGYKQKHLKKETKKPYYNTQKIYGVARIHLYGACAAG